MDIKRDFENLKRVKLHEKSNEIFIVESYIEFLNRPLQVPTSGDILSNNDVMLARMRGAGCFRRAVTRLGNFMRTLGSSFRGFFSSCKWKGSNGQGEVDFEGTVNAANEFDSSSEFRFTVDSTEGFSDDGSSIWFKALRSIFPYCTCFRKNEVDQVDGRITIDQFLEEGRENYPVLERAASSVYRVNNV